MEPAHLLSLWDLRWPGMPKIPYAYRSAVERWVRFHTLPQSKRYPDTEDEYGIVLDRHNIVLSELIDGRSALLITAGYSDHPDPGGDVRSAATVSVHPGAAYWTSAIIDDSEPESWWIHLYVNEIEWSRGVLDGLLRLVADDQIGNVTVTDPDACWLYHPYDGGMDVLLPSTAERDALRDRHRDWLSGHPRGL